MKVDETEQLRSQPSEATTREEYEKLNVNNHALGEKAMNEANEMLDSYAGEEFSSALDLVKVWDSVVRPISDKYGVEISSKIFTKGDGFRFGTAYSDGNPVGVNTSLAGDVAGWNEYGYVHTHPGNQTFSGQDINWLKYRGPNSINMRAYVTLANRQIWEGRLGGKNGIQKRVH